MKLYKAQNSRGTLLNANENPNNIHQKIIQKIQKELGQVEFNRYPENTSKQVREAYSKYCKVPANQILVGNGSDEMLGLLISLNIGVGKKLYVLEKDFSMYDYYAGMQKGEVVTFPFPTKASFDVEAFIAFGKEKQVNMIVLSNPNNPTGKVIEKQDLIQIVEEFRDIIVIVDEAYGEFYEESMLDMIDLYPNLLVTRTLSKAFGLAGIRCGFMLGHRLLIEEIEPYKVPYNVNTLTQLSASITLEYYEEIMKDIECICKLRDAMYQAYQDAKIDHVTLYPSKANYFFGETKYKDKLLEEMEKENIVIRNFDGDEFRISVGSEEDNQRVLDILKRI